MIRPARDTIARGLQDGRATVAGVLSGTSADGIDVALATFGDPPQPLSPRCEAFESVPFEPELRSRVRAVLEGEPLGLRGTALLSRDLGRAFGASARAVAERSDRRLDLVASLGQTVYHHDGGEESGGATLQLGDGDFVAEAAGCAAVSDFRQRDIAAGGEGAPLVGLVDDFLFAAAPRPARLLNLGGIANLTILDAGGADPLAFDVGPAGCLLDGLSRRLLDAEFDSQGACAQGGTADEEIVARFARHPFFAAAPPKSTGRDTFGSSYTEHFLEAHRGAEPKHVLASAVHLVGRTVAEALERHGPPGDGPLIVAGGGLHNRALTGAIADATGREVRSSSRYGVDPDAREALAFATLGAMHVLGVPATRPRVTGARAGRILGKFSPHEVLR